MSSSELSREDGDWKQVEYKRKSHAIEFSAVHKDTEKNYRLLKPIARREHVDSLGTSTKTESLDSSIRDVQSLIGKPVIRFHTSADMPSRNNASGVKPSEQDKKRKGGEKGLLYVRLSDGSDKRMDAFDTQKEVWPGLENMKSEETFVLPGAEAASAWSNVVKAPPKPKPRLIPMEKVRIIL